MERNHLTLNPENSPIEQEKSRERYILVQLEKFTFVFPSFLVQEILLVQRSQLLNLPFYQPTILGVIYQDGKIVPLLSLRQSLGIMEVGSGDKLTTVRLNNTAGNLAGLGIVVDRIIGSRFREELAADLFSNIIPSDSDSTMRLFQPEILMSDLWKPLRWA
jgi:chemotaxis signal transduction protein